MLCFLPKTVPETTTELALCEIEAFGAPIRYEIEMIKADEVEKDDCSRNINLDQTTSRDLTTDEKIDILKLHNAYRRSIGGTGVFKLDWSNELAENSRFFAKQCEFKHSVKALAKKIIDFNYGESIAVVHSETEQIIWDQVKIPN